MPATGSLSGESKAPAGLLVLHFSRSSFSSVSVGTLKPLGHGLLVPLTPCHKLSFCGSRQSIGREEDLIKLLCPGVSESANVVVVPDVLI